jgi:hypothetical protein
MNKKQSRRSFIKASAVTSSVLMLPGTLSQLVAEKLNMPAFQPSSDDLLEQLGFIDVTMAPYNADPTGLKDSTFALQHALNESRNKQLVCFFPSGTYLISNTLSCEQRVEKLDAARYTDDMRQSWWDIRTDRFYILGSTKGGKRPVIKVAPGTKGFGDPNKPRLAMKIWAQTRNDVPGTHDPDWDSEQPNISFGHIMRGIDFDIRGNAGAIGLRHAGSQGTLLMDCAVKADGALGGFYNCPGQGGGTYNIETHGGSYGLIADANYRFPMLASCTFKGQTIAPILYSAAMLPMMLVGCYLESNGKSVIDLSNMYDFPGISLVDCVVQMNKPGPLMLQNRNQNLFMENVYIKGATHLQNNTVKISKPKIWTEVKRYSSCSPLSENLINGVKSTDMLFEWKHFKGSPPFQELHNKHWRTLPSFEDSDAVNIKDFGAVGNGEADDTQAFKNAIKASKKIFFPHGRYNITEALTLEPGMQLFGMNSSSISVPVIKTYDSKEDDTFFSFISINGTIEWGSGKGIMGFSRGRMQFTENGGGRFYAMRGIGGQGEGLFEGTQMPLYLYTLNIERRTTNPQAFVRNVKSLRIYYLKCEASPVGYHVDKGPDTGNTPLAILESNDVKVYCASGNVLTSQQRPFIDVVNSRNVMVSQIKSFKTDNFPQIRETFGAQIMEISSKKTAALFIRD